MSALVVVGTIPWDLWENTNKANLKMMYVINDRLGWQKPIVLHGHISHLTRCVGGGLLTHYIAHIY